MSYEYKAEVVRVIDGDTVVFRLTKEFEFPVDFGFYIQDFVKLTKTTEQKFRLFGIDAPETAGETRQLGLASKIELERLLGLGSLKVVTYKPDKYGRWLAVVFLILQHSDSEQQLININEELIKTGFAKPYGISVNT